MEEDKRPRLLVLDRIVKPCKSKDWVKKATTPPVRHLSTTFSREMRLRIRQPHKEQGAAQEDYQQRLQTSTARTWILAITIMDSLAACQRAEIKSQPTVVETLPKLALCRARQAAYRPLMRLTTRIEALACQTTIRLCRITLYHSSPCPAQTTSWTRTNSLALTGRYRLADSIRTTLSLRMWCQTPHRAVKKSTSRATCRKSQAARATIQQRLSSAPTTATWSRTTALLAKSATVVWTSHSTTIWSRTATKSSCLARMATRLVRASAPSRMSRRIEKLSAHSLLVTCRQEARSKLALGPARMLSKSRYKLQKRNVKNL